MSEKEIVLLGRLEEYNSNVPWMIYIEKIDLFSDK